MGDCFTGAIGLAAKAAGVPFSGGPLGSALDFHRAFCEPNGSDVTFREPPSRSYAPHRDANEQYRKFLSEAGARSLGASPVPLVATFGFSVYLLAQRENWQIYRDRDGEFPAGFLDSQLFADIVLAMSCGALEFYRYVRGLGVRTLAVMAPQRIPATSDPAVFARAEDVVAAALSELGVEVVDIRSRTTDAEGRQRPELCDPSSPVHGNLAFGRLILAELLARGL